MAKFVVDLQRTASTSASVGVLSAGGRRLRVYDVMFGSEATPADAAILWSLNRTTGAGTSTAVTPVAADAGDTTAASATAGENSTIEPTYTAAAFMLQIPLNQRATFRWVAAPGGELTTLATAGNGYGVRTSVISTGTPVVTATLHFDE
mgnify:CR=1 FL=1